MNPSHKNMKKTTPWYIITKLLKTSHKEKGLRNTQRKHVISRGTKVKVTLNFSLATYKPEDIGKSQGEKQLTLNSIPGKNIFISSGEIKMCSDVQKLKEFITIRPELQALLKGIL